MSDAAVEEQAVKERKGILTIGNAWLVFSVVAGTVSILSAFAPHLPVENWSATITNILSAYRATVREPLRDALAPWIGNVPEGFADFCVFLSVFWAPTFVTVAFASYRDVEVRRSIIRGTVSLVGVVGAFLLYVIGRSAWSGEFDGRLDGFIVAVIIAALLLSVVLVWFPLALLMELCIFGRTTKLGNVAVVAFARVLAVLILVGSTVLANHALFRVGY